MRVKQFIELTISCCIKQNTRRVTRRVFFLSFFLYVFIYLYIRLFSFFVYLLIYFILFDCFLRGYANVITFNVVQYCRIQSQTCTCNAINHIMLAVGGYCCCRTNNLIRSQILLGSELLMSCSIFGFRESNMFSCINFVSEKSKLIQLNICIICPISASICQDFVIVYKIIFALLSILIL